jgi:hypothetical protein
MAKIDLRQLEGGAALCDWFGGSPSFHDAKLSTLDIRQGADSVLVAHIFKAGPELTRDGYYVQTNQAVVTFTMSKIIDVELHDIMEAAIMDGLDIERDEVGTTLSFGSNYGARGRLRAERVSLSFAPE